MKRSNRPAKVKVSADGDGVVSHAGAELLREMATVTGLVEWWDDALLDTYKAFPTVHLPGQVLADLAVAVADGAKSIGCGSCRGSGDLRFSHLVTARADR